MEFVHDALLNYLIAFNKYKCSGATQNLGLVIVASSITASI